MIYLKCTQKLLKSLKVKPEEAAPQPLWLYSWHVHWFTIDYLDSLLFTNDLTRYSVYVPLPINHSPLPPSENIGRLFKRHLVKGMKADGIEQAHIERVKKEFKTYAFCKTDNRSVRGTQTDLTYMVEDYLYGDKGLSHIDLAGLHKFLNEIPHSPLKKDISGHRAFVRKLGELEGKMLAQNVFPLPIIKADDNYT